MKNKTAPKKVRTLLILATLAVGVPSLGAAGPKGKSEIQTGFAIAPVPLDLKGKNRASVARGSYIVNAQGACNDCHTCPSYAAGSDPYTGGDGEINTSVYLAGGTRFDTSSTEEPIVYSANLTVYGKPDGKNLEMFLTHMRTGQHGREILQVMPWPVFRHMTDSDLKAIYAYLSAIPELDDTPNGACPGPRETAQ